MRYVSFFPICLNENKNRAFHRRERENKSIDFIVGKERISRLMVLYTIKLINDLRLKENDFSLIGKETSRGIRMQFTADCYDFSTRRYRRAVKSSKADDGPQQCRAPLRGVKSALQCIPYSLPPLSHSVQAPLLNVRISAKNRRTSMKQVPFSSVFRGARIRVDPVYSCGTRPRI